MNAEQAGPLRVLVVARQPLVCAGLRGLLAERPGVLVVGYAASAEELVSLAVEVEPHAVLAAWEPGEREAAVGLAERVAAAHLPLVLIGDQPSQADLGLVLRAGTAGFLLSDASPDEVAAALNAARSGLLVVDARLAESLPISAPPPESEGDEPLTERELQVLQLLAMGLPNKTIAARLRISEHTVKFHVGSILAKLNAASRTEAVTRAARRGLLTL